MLNLEVIDNKRQHFLVRGDEPFRIEISVDSGRVVAHVYRGYYTDTEQIPDGCYDGHIGLHNKHWRVEKDQRAPR